MIPEHDSEPSGASGLSNTARWYKCNGCGVYVRRPGKKFWMVSYCEELGRNTRLYRKEATRK